MDSVRYTNQEETFVHILPENISTPYPGGGYDVQISNWEQGKSDDWLAQEAAYLNYEAIMAYDQEVLDYDQCLIDNPETPEICIYPNKPQGYYTQEEVDVSEGIHAQWVIDKAEWDSNPENAGQPYPVPEPVILQIPADLPVVPAPPPLVPNTIAPYDQYYGVTEEDIDAAINASMLRTGNALTMQDNERLSVNSPGIIEDRPAHDAYMNTLHIAEDAGNVVTPKPPAVERQLLPIAYEEADHFTFTRFQDTWGWQWELTLTRKEANNLSIGIYDSAGNYLYTIGALVDNGDGTFSGVCPPGQADPTPEDVYFIWLLGSGHISALEVYKGSDDVYEGYVRSDERYDL